MHGLQGWQDSEAYQSFLRDIGFAPEALPDPNPHNAEPWVQRAMHLRKALARS